jgi:hypothetical protein
LTFLLKRISFLSFFAKGIWDVQGAWKVLHNGFFGFIFINKSDNNASFKKTRGMQAMHEITTPLQNACLGLLRTHFGSLGR